MISCNQWEGVERARVDVYSLLTVNFPADHDARLIFIYNFPLGQWLERAVIYLHPNSANCSEASVDEIGKF